MAYDRQNTVSLSENEILLIVHSLPKSECECNTTAEWQAVRELEKKLVNQLEY